MTLHMEGATKSDLNTWGGGYYITPTEDCLFVCDAEHTTPPYRADAYMWCIGARMDHWTTGQRRKTIIPYASHSLDRMKLTMSVVVHRCTDGLLDYRSTPQDYNPLRQP